ncbi:hypothetical protein MMC21_002113 [Puttea exsequens]|nr:hypothetical protein [Puttea exsequens]
MSADLMTDVQLSSLLKVKGELNNILQFELEEERRSKEDITISLKRELEIQRRKVAELYWDYGWVKDLQPLLMKWMRGLGDGIEKLCVVAAIPLEGLDRDTHQVEEISQHIEKLLPQLEQIVRLRKALETSNHQLQVKVDEQAREIQTLKSSNDELRSDLDLARANRVSAALRQYSMTRFDDTLDGLENTLNGLDATKQQVSQETEKEKATEAALMPQPNGSIVLNRTATESRKPPTFLQTPSKPPKAEQTSSKKPSEYSTQFKEQNLASKRAYINHCLRSLTMMTLHTPMSHSKQNRPEDLDMVKCVFTVNDREPVGDLFHALNDLEVFFSLSIASQAAPSISLTIKPKKHKIQNPLSRRTKEINTFAIRWLPASNEPTIADLSFYSSPTGSGKMLYDAACAFKIKKGDERLQTLAAVTLTSFEHHPSVFQSEDWVGLDRKLRASLGVLLHEEGPHRVAFCFLNPWGTDFNKLNRKCFAYLQDAVKHGK